MNTNHKLGAVREIALVGRLLRATVIATAVFALAFVVAPYIIAEANAATNVGGRITWSAIDLTFDPDAGATDDAVAAAAEEKGSALTEEEEAAVREATRALEGHGNVDFGTVIPTATNVDSGEVGTLKVEKKKISVATRGGYYAVYLSMVNETAGENPNPADTALNYDGATDTSMRINATSGTWDTPKTLVQMVQVAGVIWCQGLRSTRVMELRVCSPNLIARRLRTSLMVILMWRCIKLAA